MATTNLVRRATPSERARFAGRGRAADQMRTRTFDAAGASGLAFLNGQLELLDMKLVEPLSANTHARDIPIKIGGGFPEFISAYASDYGTTGTKFFGLQGNNNTEIPEAQANINKGLWRTYNWSVGMTVTYIDLKKLEFAQRTGIAPPFSLQDLYEKGIRITWEKALDWVTYNGFMGDPGLVNNPAVPETALLTGASTHTTWATKTPVEMLNDVNMLQSTAIANSGYDVENGMPDRLLVPWSVFGLITQPMTLGGIGGFESVKDYIERSCIAATVHGRKFNIYPAPNNWLAGVGAGATDRCVCYRCDEDDVVLHIPTPMQKGMTVPTMKAAGGAYETSFVGNISQVVFKRTQTIIYGDGI